MGFREPPASGAQAFGLGKARRYYNSKDRHYNLTLHAATWRLYYLADASTTLTGRLGGWWAEVVGLRGLGARGLGFKKMTNFNFWMWGLRGLGFRIKGAKVRGREDNKSGQT